MSNELDQIETENELSQSDQTKGRNVEERPDIYHFTDYKAFIKQMLEYFARDNSKFSIRKFAAEAGISHGYLTIIFKSAQHIAPKTIEKLIPALRLSPAEGSYLRLLRDLASPLSPDERSELFSRLQKFHQFKEKKPNESLVIGYLRNWYQITIREMAHDPDFKLDSQWIRGKFLFPVPTVEIERAIKFLVDNGFLLKRGGKKAEVTTKDVWCDEHIFSLALASVHKQFFELASASIDVVAREQRSLEAQVMRLDTEGFSQAKKIMREALDKIAALEISTPSEARVFNVAVLGFPLTSVKESL
jgi:uncharacterized protein (TIGR02147 family)